MTITHLAIDDLVELDARESSGVHVTLVWNRATRQASVLVSDGHSGEAFSIAVERDDNALELFHHPFGYATRPRRTGAGSCAAGYRDSAESARATEQS